MNDARYDVLVVGGGLTGVSLARALGGAGLDVAAIDAVRPDVADHPSYDDRAIALSLGSMRILQGLGFTGSLLGRTAPIRRVHVSDRGHFGFTRMDAARHGLEALGYVTDARTLGFVLHETQSQSAGFEVFCPAVLEAVRPAADAVEVRVRRCDTDVEERLTARLLVGADGASSPVRNLLGIRSTRHDYRQCAITANVTPERGHRHTAYERFLETGPLAMLPMTQRRCGVVWTLPDADAARVLQLDDEDFVDRLLDRFGSRLGGMREVGRRSVHPLSLVKCAEHVTRRAVLVGNAAHTLHPVAGQGLNLGLRDVAALAETVVDAVRAGRDPGEPDTLRAYQDWRSRDQREVTFFTDALVRLFGLEHAPIRVGRNLGLLALDVLPGLKRGFVRRAVGLAGRQSRLARGLAL